MVTDRSSHFRSAGKVGQISGNVRTGLSPRRFAGLGDLRSNCRSWTPRPASTPAEWDFARQLTHPAGWPPCEEERDNSSKSFKV